MCRVSMRLGIGVWRVAGPAGRGACSVRQHPTANSQQQAPYAENSQQNVRQGCCRPDQPRPEAHWFLLGPHRQTAVALLVSPLQ